MVSSRLDELVSDTTELAEVIGGLNARYVELGNALSELASVFPERIDIAERARQTCIEHLDALKEQTIAAEERITGIFHEASGSILNEVRSAVEEGVLKTKDYVSSLAEEGLSPVVRSASSQVEEMLAEFTRRITNLSGDSERESASLSMAIDQLKPVIDQLMDEFNRVSELADKVGM